MKNKKSFVLYADVIHTVIKLPDDKAGLLFKHLLAYVNDEHPETDDIIVEIAFEPIKQQLKRDLNKWTNEKETRSNSGKEGNLKRWHFKIYKEFKKGLITLDEAIKKSKLSQPDSTQSHPIAKIAVNDNVTVNVNVNEIKKEVFNLWIDYRKELNKPIKVKSTLEALIKTFNKEPLAKCVFTVNHSIENSYQGLFWDKYKPLKGEESGSKVFKPSNNHRHG